MMFKNCQLDGKILILLLTCPKHSCFEMFGSKAIRHMWIVEMRSYRKFTVGKFCNLLFSLKLWSLKLLPNVKNTSNKKTFYHPQMSFFYIINISNKKTFNHPQTSLTNIIKKRPSIIHKYLSSFMNNIIKETFYHPQTSFMNISNFNHLKTSFKFYDF